MNSSVNYQQAGKQKLAPAHRFKNWLKQSDSAAAIKLKSMYYGVRFFSLPLPRALSRALFYCHQSVVNCYHWLSRSFYYTPLFKSQTQRCGQKLYLYGGMPYICGPLALELGSHCRISGASTFSARSCAGVRPHLSIGDNVDVGWQTTIAVGTSVTLGNNVRIAGQCFLAGYAGHPIDARERALGLPEHEHQAREIALEQDVWLGTGVTVLAGVRIGAGSIVAAGSVVHKSLPAGVIAAGNPATIIKKIGERDEQ
ncbi:acyltransferase [Agaribacterium haliotis]|uniref:acyltransferase n=1 Tax=Agaribacterium haliotis TaxID=2013869 RepID=UPI001304742D|nr:acyltransferase [Agaribacterium haliotis]